MLIQEELFDMEDTATITQNGSPVVPTPVGKVSKATPEKKQRKRLERPYPTEALEEAIKVPIAIKDKNAGKPLSPPLVAEAIGRGAKTDGFFYVTKASRDFGFTLGTRDAKEISLEPLGKDFAYAGNEEEEYAALQKAFLSIPIFKNVLDHYGSDDLPEMQYLSNTLEKDFGLVKELHLEFTSLFKKNYAFANFNKESVKGTVANKMTSAYIQVGSSNSNIVTVGDAADTQIGLCFVALPFRERTTEYREGHFHEVLSSLVTPAATEAGFQVRTAKRDGTEVIQSTIVNMLLSAELVLVDLTEHNPNVLFELGMRIALNKPVVLMRAEGTAPVFDVDNMLRVFDYKPQLWPSTIEVDIPRLRDHIKATWEDKESLKYMEMLVQRPLSN